MGAVVKSIVDKLKIKEIIGIIFIASLLITFLPDDIAEKLNLLDFRKSYQTYLTICIIVTASYYLFSLLRYLSLFILGKIINDKKIAINYMKRNMSPDEMGLLVQTFYDFKMNRFKSSGQIDITDGRKAPLESKKVIYLASQLGDFLNGFSYNLQPYALEYLNAQLQKGNIVFRKDGISWHFD